VCLRELLFCFSVAISAGLLMLVTCCRHARDRFMVCLLNFFENGGGGWSACGCLRSVCFCRSDSTWGPNSSAAINRWKHAVV
jgi:hypothetical protein